MDRVMNIAQPLRRRPESWSCGLVVLISIGMLVLAPACQTTGSDGRRSLRPRGQKIIRRVVCLYDHHPWLNLDRGGDRDVEGIACGLALPGVAYPNVDSRLVMLLPPIPGTCVGLDVGRVV